MFNLKPKPFRPTEPVIGWRLGRTQRKVLLRLEIAEGNGYVRKSGQDIANEVGIDRRNVYSVLRELMSMGYIRMIEKGKGGRRFKDGSYSWVANLYEITYVPKKKHKKSLEI